MHQSKLRPCHYNVVEMHNYSTCLRNEMSPMSAFDNLRVTNGICCQNTTVQT